MSVRARYVPMHKRGQASLKLSSTSGLKLSSTITPNLQDTRSFPALSKHVNGLNAHVSGMSEYANAVSNNNAVTEKEVNGSDISPGWVKLSRGKNGELLQEYADNVLVNDALAHSYSEVSVAMQHLTDTLDKHNALYQSTDEFLYQKPSIDYDSFDESDEESIDED